MPSEESSPRASDGVSEGLDGHVLSDGESVDDADVDSGASDEEPGRRWPLLMAILFGVLLGGVLAAVVWFLNFGGF